MLHTMGNRTWTEDQFICAVRGNISIAGVLRDLGLSFTGANYKTVHIYVERLNLNTSHWTGQAHMRGKSHRRSRHKRLKDSVIFIENSTVAQHITKRRALEIVFKEKKCKLCGLLEEWNGKPLVLRLDHINGVNRDNRKSNLRLLCPNCDSQQPTFAGRNIRKKQAAVAQLAGGTYLKNRTV